jgi:RNA polymerase sigma-B factor
MRSSEVIGAEDPRMESVADRTARHHLLAELPERERQITGLRFFESLTQSEIAERISVSQMHVTRTLADLRERLLAGDRQALTAAA